MFRAVTGIGALLLAIGCSSVPSESLSPTEPQAYLGAWKSTTPNLEFVRFTVTEWSVSSRYGDLGAQLALSGLRYDGTGRIEGDSLVMEMFLPDFPAQKKSLVARSRDGRTLFVRWHTEGAPTELTFIRE